MWIWRERFRARSRIGRGVEIWFHPEYSAPELVESRRIPNVQLDRADRVLGLLTDLGIVRVTDVRSPPLAGMDELGWVHDSGYLESSLEPATLARIFGVPPEAIDVDIMVQAQRRAVGGTIAAARRVANGDTRIGFNLGGGFHHAERAKASGFSIYNDIAVAIAALRHARFDERIAVIDLDFHQGNGTRSIFADDDSVLTYSVHGSAWEQTPAIANIDVQLPPRTGDDTYLQTLEKTLPEALHDARLVFYIAGNDVLAGDALGDFLLTPRGVLERDMLVSKLARDKGLVVTMGGGYSGQAWRATAAYLRWLLTGNVRVRRYPNAPVRQRFRQISRGLGASELQRVDTGELSFDESDFTTPRSRLILGYYTKQGIELALERFGFLSELRKRGFAALRLDIGGLDVTAPALRIYGRDHGEGAELLLVELVVRKKTIASELGNLDLLMIEWLLLQNPTKRFTADKPRLPGQNYPGLGLSELMLELLLRIVARLRLEGLLSRPAHYHNAALASPSYQFLDPVIEGRFRAMRRALAPYPIPEATRIVDEGRLVDGSGNPVTWQPGDQIYPASPRLKAHFASDIFASKTTEALNQLLAGGLHVICTP